MKILVLLVVLLFTFSFGQGCFVELSQNWSKEELAGQITNIEAGFLVRVAVDLLEPNLPQLVSIPYDFDLQPSNENYKLFHFLLEIGLIDSHTDFEQMGVKTKLINRLRSWYDLPKIEVAENLTKSELINVLNNIITSTDLQAVALVASGETRNTISFWSIIRNDSIYPRMIVFNPPNREELNLENGVREVLNHLNNCAYSVEKYIFSSATTAEQLFLGNFESRMIIVASTPHILEGYLEVPQGQETDFFTFNSETLSTVSSFAAVFTEQELKPLKIMRLLPRVRTNMNPKQILDFLRGN